MLKIPSLLLHLKESPFNAVYYGCHTNLSLCLASYGLINFYTAEASPYLSLCHLENSYYIGFPLWRICHKNPLARRPVSGQRAGRCEFLAWRREPLKRKVPRDIFSRQGHPTRSSLLTRCHRVPAPPDGACGERPQDPAQRGIYDTSIRHPDWGFPVATG